MSANSALIEGQVLTLPAGVTKSAYNASTFKPYDPAEAIGDLSPTTPKPTKKPKCGLLLQIVSAVFAAAATYFVGPILGNVASQGFNNLIGIQDGFSWKSLGLAVASAAVTMGVGSALGTGAMAGSQFVGDVVRGAATSALTQGVGVATGLQSRFDFAGVAAAGIGNGVNGAVGGAVGGSFGGTMLASTAGGIANAATRSAINGNSFGDNLRAAIPDIIAQTFLSTMRSGFEQGSMERATANPTEGSGQTTGDAYADEIVVTGSYNLWGIGSRAFGSATRIAVPADIAQGIAGDGEFNMEAFFPEMPPERSRARTEWEPGFGGIVVTAPRQVKDRSIVRAVTPITRPGFWRSLADQHPLLANTFKAGVLGNVIRLTGGNKQIMGEYTRSRSAALAGWRGVGTGLVQTAADSLIFNATVVNPALLTNDTFRAIATGASDRQIDRAKAIVSAPFLAAGKVMGGTAMLFDAGAFNRGSAAEGAAYIVSGGAELALTAAPATRLFGRSSLVAEGLPSIEGLYQTRYASAYERGVVFVDGEIIGGRMVAPAGQPPHLYRANQIDDFARQDLRVFARTQGHGGDVVRINQRLYLENGRYRVPDVYFPQSGTILDGTLGFKSARTPQVIDFRAANNNAPVGIIRPAGYGGSYWIGQ